MHRGFHEPRCTTGPETTRGAHEAHTRVWAKKFKKVSFCLGQRDNRRGVATGRSFHFAWEPLGAARLKERSAVPMARKNEVLVRKIAGVIVPLILKKSCCRKELYLHKERAKQFNTRQVHIRHTISDVDTFTPAHGCNDSEGKMWSSG